MNGNSKNMTANNVANRNDITQVPGEFADAIVWAAWLYYVDQLTQSEVAKRVGVSRATIINYLQEAKEQGLVSIVINEDALAQTSLARKLSAKFGLDACQVIPSLDDPLQLNNRLGIAAAKYLATLIEPNDIIGVAWGKTVLAVAKAMARDTRPDVSIVQVVGSSAGSAEFSPELCTSIMANRINARCVNMHAPTMLSSEALRNQLLAEPSIQEQFLLIHSCSKIIFGIGDINAQSTIRASGFVTPDEIEAYTNEGAEAVILGRFVNNFGEAIMRETDHRMMGITLDRLKKIPTRLCVSGGKNKIKPMKATLMGGFVTHLITDVESAEALLEA